jgi:hypothetical protein
MGKDGENPVNYRPYSRRGTNYQTFPFSLTWYNLGVKCVYQIELNTIL